MNYLLNLRKNHLFVGRAATGIYLILKSLFENKDVLLPANICYAAVYPILFSNNNLIFCDVDLNSMNITLSEIKKRITINTKAILIPHMYGNPCVEIADISDYCKKNDIILIEDCASSAGAKIHGKECGTFGDYAVFSFGYSKTIEFGNGGLVLSDNSLTELEKSYELLPFFSNVINENNSYFSKQYRIFRNSNCDFEKSRFSDIVKNKSKDDFLYKLPFDFFERNADVKKIVDLRLKNAKLYDSLIDFSVDTIQKFKFNDESSPWRYVFFIDSGKHRGFIDLCLQKNIPISDWYPVVSNLFYDKEIYENSSTIESKILNLPLLIDESEIIRISNEINIIIGILKSEEK